MNLSKFGLIAHQCSTIKVGDRYGRLLVTAIGKRPNTYRYMAVCQCDCGSPLFTTRMDALKRGVTLSCGCFHREQHRTHGVSKHPLWGVHRHMMSRCYDPTVTAFPDYGGRGISVCERWHNVENFYADVIAIYRKGLFLDRIDNDGNYEPNNIRFTTRTVNNNNRRTVNKITFKEQTLSLKQWSRELGLNYGTLRSRLSEGWSVEKAFSTPARPIQLSN